MILFSGSKVKVTSRINAHIVNAQYLPNRKAYKILVHRWSTKTRISDKRRDLQGQRSRSQGHVTRLTGTYSTLAPIYDTTFLFDSFRPENEMSWKHQNLWEGYPPDGQQCLLVSRSKVNV